MTNTQIRSDWSNRGQGMAIFLFFTRAQQYLRQATASHNRDTCRKLGDVPLFGGAGSPSNTMLPVQSSNWTSDLFSTYSYIFNVN